MKIAINAIKELRENTGAGMMDCKKALENTDGDIGPASRKRRQPGSLIWFDFASCS